MTPEDRAIDENVGTADAGRRFDLYLSSLFGDCSRSRAAELIRNGHVTIGGAVKKPGYRLQAGDRVTGKPPAPVQAVFQPEAIPLDILFEDSYIIVLNKPAGMVVHPAPGHASGTLVNALLHHCQDLSGIGGELRPGIVHRLDKDTSGTLVVAKNEPALNHLAAQFKNRTVLKTYLALVRGNVSADRGEIRLPIGRHAVHRKKMSVRSHRARSAHTEWALREHLGGTSLLEVNLKTGRTHQIRVHCTAIGHPIVGDPVYGGRRQRTEAVLDSRGSAVSIPGRQMLHAWRLGIVHPVTGEWMTFESQMPADMTKIIEWLRGGGAS